jgi:hypothetical protein
MLWLIRLASHKPTTAVVQSDVCTRVRLSYTWDAISGIPLVVLRPNAKILENRTDAES